MSESVLDYVSLGVAIVLFAATCMGARGVYSFYAGYLRNPEVWGEKSYRHGILGMLCTSYLCVTNFWIYFS